MADFALTAEQKEFRKWVHDFAEKEIRPVASEYDETEEFPWPVLKKAAEIGLYAFDFYMQVGQDDSGLMMPIALEESAWGCAGITLGIFGTGLPLAAWRQAGRRSRRWRGRRRCSARPSSLHSARSASPRRTPVPTS